MALDSSSDTAAEDTAAATATVPADPARRPKTPDEIEDLIAQVCQSTRCRLLPDEIDKVIAGICRDAISECAPQNRMAFSVHYVVSLHHLRAIVIFSEHDIRKITVVVYDVTQMGEKQFHDLRSQVKDVSRNIRASG